MTNDEFDTASMIEAAIKIKRIMQAAGEQNLLKVICLQFHEEKNQPELVGIKVNANKSIMKKWRNSFSTFHRLGI